MTLASASVAIFTQLMTSWATASVIEWPNHNFIPPDNAPWIRPVIKIPSTIVGELGDDGVGLRDGLLMVSLFDQKGNGSQTLNKLADRLETIFRRADVSGIWFDEPSSNPAGQDPNGYYHIMMSVDFHCWVGE